MRTEKDNASALGRVTGRAARRLTYLFVLLKLTGAISWPWLWVLVPFWGSIAVGLAALLIGFLLTLIVVVLDS